MDPASAFIDSTPTFEAYRAAGFVNLMDSEYLAKLNKAPEMKAPGWLGFSKLLGYLKNFFFISPRPSTPNTIPEGVKVLGGTYVLDADSIAFSHQDKVPGATPEIADVLAAAGVTGVAMKA